MERDISKLLVYSSLLLGCLTTTVFALLSFASIETFRYVLNESLGQRYAAAYTPQFHETLTSRLLLAMCVSAIGTSVVAWLRGSIEHWLSRVLSAWRHAGRELATDMRVGLQAVGCGWVTVCVLTLAAVALRLLFLFDPIEWDEATTFIRFASRPLWFLISWYAEPNNHVFHSSLVHFSTLAFGSEPWAVRLPAFIAGVLVVPATYVLGALAHDRHTALIGGALAVVSPLLINNSASARGYSMLCLFALLLAIAVVYAIQRDNRLAWFSAAVFSALGFYTIPTMIYAVAVVLVWAAALCLPGKPELIPPRLLLRRSLEFVSGAMALATVLYLPILVISGPKAILANRWVQPLTWPELADLFAYRASVLWTHWHANTPTGLKAMLVIGAAVGVMRAYSSWRQLPVLCGAVVLAPILLLQRVAPYPRVFVFLLPFYLLASASGIAWSVKWLGRSRDPVLIRVIILVAILLSGTIAYNVIKSHDLLENPRLEDVYADMREVAEFLRQELRPGDKLYTAGNDPLAYYLLTYKLQGHVEADLFTATRVLVFVHRYEDVQTVIEKERLRPSDFSEPRLLYRSRLSQKVFELLPATSSPSSP